ncbi:MAG: hypothetical protein P1R58_02935 [bacterium]|nr:hypothetical protein [bacterium]
MALTERFPRVPILVATLLICLISLSAAPDAQAQFPFDIVLTVGDTTAIPNEVNTVISVYLDNFNDTLAGFKVWIQLDRPDLIKFQTSSGTATDTTYWICNADSMGVCLDSTLTTPIGAWDFFHITTTVIEIGNHDVSGTLIENWEFVDSRSLSGLGFDIAVSAFANMPAPPETPGIPPQQGGLLVKVLADVFDVPDEQLERTVNLIVQHDFIDNINFSRPDGSSIGILYEPYMDTTCWVCMAWCGQECCDLQKQSLPPGGDYANCDSLAIRPDSSAYLDTSRVILNDGSLTVLVPDPYICGDVNCDGGHLADISDLTYMVEFLFGGGPAPCDPIERGDLNCSGGGTPVDISDLTYMVDYLFGGGPAPCEVCP